MPYVPFYEYFPEIAKKETRSIIAIADTDIPYGTYNLIESYCDEPGCDCRRVFLNVSSLETKKVLAVIAYGWGSEKYYAKWYGEYNPKIIKELKGPILNLTSPQSKLAPALLEKVKYVLQDRYYVERLKRHYKLFRAKIEKDAIKKKISNTSLKASCKASQPYPQISRNAPCPCGSGKKYKKCCLIKK